ncbi:MAG TPA: hypothetical protein VNW97_07240 [Candidatus Saccharimonadales bacterium]|nr:hypothetical protein [Candidatus Saccharimonadales bacterium]
MPKHVLYISVFILALAGAGFRMAAITTAAQRERPSPAERDIEDRQIKMANKKRQEDLQKDTQKLFVLAGELKEAVDKTNENMLSLSVIRKAEEVEKLAKKVKEKMREGVGKPLHVDQPPIEAPRR